VKAQLEKNAPCGSLWKDLAPLIVQYRSPVRLCAWVLTPARYTGYGGGYVAPVTCAHEAQLQTPMCATHRCSYGTCPNGVVVTPAQFGADCACWSTPIQHAANDYCDSHARLAVTCQLLLFWVVSLALVAGAITTFCFVLLDLGTDHPHLMHDAVAGSAGVALLDGVLLYYMLPTLRACITRAWSACAQVMCCCTFWRCCANTHHANDDGCLDKLVSDDNECMPCSCDAFIWLTVWVCLAIALESACITYTTKLWHAHTTAAYLTLSWTLALSLPILVPVSVLLRSCLRPTATECRWLCGCPAPVDPPEMV
jgi:hypothetical protein